MNIEVSKASTNEMAERNAGHDTARRSTTTHFFTETRQKLAEHCSSSTLFICFFLLAIGLVVATYYEQLKQEVFFHHKVLPVIKYYNSSTEPTPSGKKEDQGQQDGTSHPSKVLRTCTYLDGRGHMALAVGGAEGGKGTIASINRTRLASHTFKLSPLCDMLAAAPAILPLYTVGQWSQNCYYEYIAAAPVSYAYGALYGRQSAPHLCLTPGVAVSSTEEEEVEEKQETATTATTTKPWSFAEGVVRALSWNWYPHECELLPFSGVEMASLLANKKVLIVGDHVMLDLYHSIRFLTRYNEPSRGGKFLLTYSRSNLLVDMRTLSPLSPRLYAYCMCLEMKKQNCSTSGLPTSYECPPPEPGSRPARSMAMSAHEWTSLLKSHNLLIFQVGLRWKDIDSTFDKYPEMVERTSQYIASQFTGTVVYLTWPDGHSKCESYQQPSQHIHLQPLPERTQVGFQATIPSLTLFHMIFLSCRTLGTLESAVPAVAVGFELLLGERKHEPVQA